MGSRIRLIEPNVVYSGAQRCVDRSFLFVPNQHKENRLLAAGCSLDSLLPNNDHLPIPSIINIVGSSIGRALENQPVKLHYFEGNINHLHPGFSANTDQMENVSAFLRDANSLIARQLNKTWQRDGAVFAGNCRLVPCLDDSSAEEKLTYALTNVVKDNQVAKVGQAPFFSTYKHLAHGEPLKFWYIDWDTYWKVGGPRKKNNRPKDYLKWTQWNLAPLPGWQDWPEHKRQARVRNLVKEAEEEFADKRLHEKRTVIGVPALYNLSPRQRPQNPKPPSQQPLCHTKARSQRRAFKRKWREFQNEYRKASIDYRLGNFEREFPVGSYPPPLIKIYLHDTS